MPPKLCNKRSVDFIPLINEVSVDIDEQATVTFITKDGATILVSSSDITGLHIMQVQDKLMEIAIM